MTGWFRYGRTADSDLGVGYSGNGANWRLTGTVHMGKTQAANVTFGGLGPFFGKQLKSEFLYVMEEAITFCPFFTSKPWYRIRAVQWNGGALHGQDVSNWDGAFMYQNTPWTHKQGFHAGTKFHRDRGEAATYTSEVVVFGVQLSAQSGYSTKVVAHWDFGSRDFRHYLIGKDGAVTEASIIYSY